MKKVMIVVLAAFLMAATIGYADDNVDRKTVEELLEVMNMESLIQSMHSQIEQISKSASTQLEIKENERYIFDNYMKKVNGAVMEELSWDKLKDQLIDIYVKHYTQKEIEEILAFYRTETGQSLIKKMPLVMQDSMQISQSMMQSVMPKIQQYAQEMQEDLRKAREGQGN